MDLATEQFLIFETACGYCGLAWSGVGITRLQLPAQSAVDAERLLRRRLRDPELGEPTPKIDAAATAIRRYFDGENIDFCEVHLDLEGQEYFFGRVYTAVRRIGWGHTTSYGALAKALGVGPAGARDVGQAMAKNPVPLIIPCHRVLAAGGKIGGFSAPGGSATKIHMLGLEGVHLAPPRPMQHALAL